MAWKERAKESHATKLYCVNLPDTKKSKFVAFGKVVVSFAALIRVVTQQSSPLAAAHSNSAFLSSN